MITFFTKETGKKANATFYDGIISIIADCRWDENEMPTEWEAKEIILNAEYDEPITLDDIRQMYSDAKVIKVIWDDSLSGKVYKWTDNGDGEYWTKYGETKGYA